MVVFDRWKLLAKFEQVSALAGVAANPIAAAATAACKQLEARRLFRSLMIITLAPCCRSFFYFGHCNLMIQLQFSSTLRAMPHCVSLGHLPARLALG